MTTALTVEDILNHPHFFEARSAHIDDLVRLFRSDRFVMEMMADASMIVLRGFLVGFHLSFDSDDPMTWATPGNLKRALVARGLASARRVDDLLARFRQAGYVKDLPSPRDQRSSILVATDRLIAHDRSHLAAYHRFLFHLFPDRGYEWTLSESEDAHRAIRREGIRHQARALSALDHDALRLFLARDAGYLAFLLAAQAQSSGASCPTWTSMSNDLGVSRSHLRTLFRGAEAAGYVRLASSHHGRVEILPALWAAYDTFLAHIEADQDALAQMAFGRRSPASQLVIEDGTRSRTVAPGMSSRLSTD